MQALGNDFIILEAVTQTLLLDSKLAKNLADRHFGIGCDQVLLLEPPRNAQEDFFYRIFNADGEEVNQCGNGARCIGRFILEKGLSQKKNLILGTRQGPIHLAFNSPDIVTVLLPKPEFEPERIPINPNTPIVPSYLGRYGLPFGNETKIATVLSLGNPHCVFCVSNIQDIDLEALATKIHRLDFFLKGVNIGIMQILAKNHIKLRVFERGSGETLACGSGACAAVIAGICNNTLSTEVKVEMAGGAAIVNWPTPESPVSLSGDTKCVFEGFFVLQNQPNFNIMLQKH